MAKATDDDGSLKRLGAGRWQTRDERFTIEPQSGTWVVVDGDQTDDLGLPLIRGPFGSLGAAKDAIATARTSAAPVKPLPRPTKAPAKHAPAPTKRSRVAVSAGTGHAAEPVTGSKAAPAPKAKPSKDAPPAEPSAEPRWIADLAPAVRRRARDSIKRLSEVGAPDPEGMTRRDVSGDVPAIAAYALACRIEDLGPGASPAAVVAALVDGRDDDLDVRWRIVDGEGRPILLPRGGSTPRR